MPSTSVQAAAWMTMSGSRPQRIGTRFAFGQIDRDVDTGIRAGTERDDRRPRSPRRGDEQAAELTARASDDHPRCPMDLARLIDSSTSDDVDTRMVAQHQADRLRAQWRSLDDDFAADQRVGDAPLDVADDAALQHDRVLDLAGDSSQSGPIAVNGPT